MVDAGRWRVLAPFRSREYRLLIAAVSLSIFAEGMWAVVMALQVIELDNDPASLSLVATCLGVGPGRVPARRRPRRGPDQPAHDHHRRRDRQHRRRVGGRGAGTRWRAADLAHGGGRSGAGHRRGVLLPGLQRDPAAGSCLPNNCWPPTASKAWCARCSSAPSAPPSPASWWVRRSRHWARSPWRCCSASACCCWWRPDPRRKRLSANRIRSGRRCCATCGTASSSCCARRGCCGPCCSRACSCWWCWARSRCCCRSSPRTGSPTARGRTASSWRSSGWAARWVRSRCRRDGCPVATCR